MVRVLRDFRRRSISPASRQEERPCERPPKRPPKRSSSARHVPGNVVGLEPPAHTLFEALNTRPVKHGRSLLAWITASMIVAAPERKKKEKQKEKGQGKAKGEQDEEYEKGNEKEQQRMKRMRGKQMSRRIRSG
eukprot:2482001-Heterocapsa_arctica.AAC.1